ncbi:hypothetical protein LR48_Vigan10g254400 [Vigna angularis]|uniref:Uncharacterized protein n=1 Tax=Phaseolus angularis TaxID=3914 RepID=A0A0L9VP23_PHAAN|nr:hypothetical protein LR48_Vigan10g254400 [Vigna angularis]
MIHEERRQRKRLSEASKKSAAAHSLRAMEYLQQGNYAFADREVKETEMSLGILMNLSSPVVASQSGKQKKRLSRSSMDKKVMVEEERKTYREFAEVHILRAMEY